MAFDHFRIRLAVRLTGILLTLLAMVLLFQTTDQYLALTLLTGLLALQVVGIYRLVDTTNQKLKFFLESIRYGDFSVGFTHDNRLGSSFRELNEQFTAVIRDFQKTRAEKEENLRYLDTVVQHVSTGLLVFDQNGKIELINTAARNLLGQTAYRNIAEIERSHPALVQAFRTLRSGGSSLERLGIEENTERQLSVQAAEFWMRGRALKLVSLQNIQVELEQKELEAWRNLARVLRHEIMNSITPISSLSGTVRELIEEEATHTVADGVDQVVLTPETFEDLRDSLETIEKRSQGLIHFVDAYRNFTSIPTPKLQRTEIRRLVQQIELLLREQAEKRRVTLLVTVDPADLHIQADPDLIEMVLINLVKNAVEAFPEAEPGTDPMTRRVALVARREEGRVAIHVADNGPGIIPEALERIFIPFYTTKRGGSGIGLSWSRQIMHQHGGSLTAQSEPDHQTVFTLRFAA